MKIINKQQEEEHYKLEFLEETETQEIKYKIEFKGFLFPKKIRKEELGFAVLLEPQNFPYAAENMLAVQPFYIPSAKGRMFFKVCFDYYAESKGLPINVTFVDHPGYPLTLVTFNKLILDSDLLGRIAKIILEAIQNTEITTEEIELEESEIHEEEDLLDSIDEANIIEFELDEEVKKEITPPTGDAFISLEEDNND